jgi:hypothetical protein
MQENREFQSLDEEKEWLLVMVFWLFVKVEHQQFIDYINQDERKS